MSYMIMLDYTEASGQRKQLPHLGGQLYHVLRTKQVYCLCYQMQFNVIPWTLHIWEHSRYSYPTVEDTVSIF